jgi:hypothetical protein
VLSISFFSFTALIGWLVARSGEAVQRIWPTVLRVQIFRTATVLTGVAVLRVTGFVQLGEPVHLSASLLIPLVGAMLVRGRRSTGEVALEA